jgi:hypothetical protein
MKAQSIIISINIRIIIRSDAPKCLALLDSIRRNWFRDPKLAIGFAIGLQKPYAKPESGSNLVLV